MSILLPIIAITASVGACSHSSATAVEIHFGIGNSATQQLSSGSDSVVVQSLQFYVHGIELLDTQGKAHSFRLTSATPWQSEQVALIDLGGDTAAHRNPVIRGSVATGAAQGYSGIRFSVGVPFELNHANPLAAAAPLDRSDLFWAWQSGYKFLRADLADAGREWSFHLGSTGCSSASAMRPPSAPCSQPNRMRVEINGIDPLRAVIRLHVDELVQSMRAASYAICTGNYAHDPACADIYAKTGMQPGSGVCPDDSCTQRLWKAD